MDWLEVIQTVALCASTILLLGITFMVFTMWATFTSLFSTGGEEIFEDDEEDYEDDEDDDPLYVYVPQNRSKSGKGRK